MIPPQERGRPGRGWSGDARTEAELQAATGSMHTAWQRLKMDTRDGAAAEGRQEGMWLAEKSAKCSSRSFLRAPRR